MKKFVAFAILASIGAAPVMAEAFTRDGVSYEYKVKTVNDATLITGRVINSGQDFRLRVKNGRVSGQVGMWPVSFRTDAAVQTAGAAAFSAAK